MANIGYAVICLGFAVGVALFGIFLIRQSIRNERSRNLKNIAIVLIAVTTGFGASLLLCRMFGVDNLQNPNIYLIAGAIYIGDWIFVKAEIKKFT
jgi:amino acid transporter